LSPPVPLLNFGMQPTNKPMLSEGDAIRQKNLQAVDVRFRESDR